MKSSIRGPNKMYTVQWGVYTKKEGNQEFYVEWVETFWARNSTQAIAACDLKEKLIRHTYLQQLASDVYLVVGYDIEDGAPQ